MNKEKDFHFNSENINSHPENKDGYTESTALLSDLKSLSLTDHEWRKTWVLSSRKQLQSLGSI